MQNTLQGVRLRLAYEALRREAVKGPKLVKTRQFVGFAELRRLYAQAWGKRWVQ